MSRFVIDASIVLSWCFPDERSPLADHVAERFQHGDVAIAPSFWPHEVLNGLLVAEKRKRISVALIHKFLSDLGTLPIDLQYSSTSDVFDVTHVLSRKHNLTAYDAAYLGLAIATGFPLATLDYHLARECEKAGVSLIKE